jgi:hypothetical protein
LFSPLPLSPFLFTARGGAVPPALRPEHILTPDLPLPPPPPPPIQSQLEEERFLPLFAQYKPDIGDTAILEWGRLYLEQLSVTLRAHAAAATSAEEKEKALLVFTDLWRAMRRLHRFGEGKIWPAASLQARLPCSKHTPPQTHVL